MGTGVQKRFDRRKKITRWGWLLRELERRETIGEARGFVVEMTAGMGFSRGDLDQATALVRTSVMPSGGGKYRVSPSVLKGMLVAATVPQDPPRPSMRGGPPPAPAVLAEAATELSPAEVTVALKYLFKLTAAEARALVAICEDFPDPLPKGSATKLGLALWNALCTDDLVLPMGGRGRGAQALADWDAFDEVRFVVPTGRRKKQARWQDLPPDLQEQRKPRSWLSELKRELGRATPEPESDARKTPPPAAALPDPPVDISRTHARLERLLGERRAALVELQHQLEEPLRRRTALQQDIELLEVELRELGRAEAKLKA